MKISVAPRTSSGKNSFEALIIKNYFKMSKKLFNSLTLHKVLMICFRIKNAAQVISANEITFDFETVEADRSESCKIYNNITNARNYLNIGGETFKHVLDHITFLLPSSGISGT